MLISQMDRNSVYLVPMIVELVRNQVNSMHLMNLFLLVIHVGMSSLSLLLQPIMELMKRSVLIGAIEIVRLDIFKVVFVLGNALRTVRCALLLLMKSLILFVSCVLPKDI